MSQRARWYFAYGSNMDQAQMRERVGEFRICIPAILRNYHLVFNAVSKKNTKAGFANIEEQHGSVVEGMLYLLSEEQLKRLDKFEGHPDKYCRIPVCPEINEGMIEYAAVYKACSDKTAVGLQPTREYLAHLLAGKAFLSSEYYRKLKKTRTVRQSRRS